ncbi:MAG: alginate lyase family protein [Planctomycetota bacterium]|nr:alginate lyase family protein [Planctomycetota bacterium]
MNTLIRTASHLKASQIYWRLMYSIKRKASLIPARADVSAAVSFNGKIPDPPCLSGIDDAEKLAADLEEGFLSLLNASHAFEPKRGWAFTNSDSNRLWAITVQYHEWLHALAIEYARTRKPRYAKLVREYIMDWIDTCKRGASPSPFAWDSYAIATRLGWWSRILSSVSMLFNDAELEKILRSYALQAEHLLGNIEWDLRANHLLRDCIGLLWAGRTLEGQIANKCYRKGVEELREQLDEQVMSDGGHFERSTMYHNQVLEDLLIAYSLVREDGMRAKILDKISIMMNFSRWMRHEDGRFPLLNDSAFNGARTYDELALAFQQSGGGRLSLQPIQGTRYFAQTGYVAHHGPLWTVFADAAPVGPDYQPGHAHADTLTIEAAYRGKRVFVDPGTYSYDEDEMRKYTRSTRAHNTVCIDGENSSEVWKIFRVGRRAYPKDVEFHCDDTGFVLSAAHGGYRHLKGEPSHKRLVDVGQREFTVVDEVKGGEEHEVSGGFLLAPCWKAERIDNCFILRRNGIRLRVKIEGPKELELRISDALHCPEFGKQMKTKRIEWSCWGELPIHVTTRVEELR